MAKGKIYRFVFVGKWWILCIAAFSIIGIPYAVMYFFHATILVEEEVEEPNELANYLLSKR